MVTSTFLQSVKRAHSQRQYASETGYLDVQGTGPGPAAASWSGSRRQRVDCGGSRLRGMEEEEHAAHSSLLNRCGGKLEGSGLGTTTERRHTFFLWTA